MTALPHLDAAQRHCYSRRVRVLRYGATATWAFRGFNLDPADPVQTAFLTIKDTWADVDEEQGPEPPRLQLAVAVPPGSGADGTFAEDDEGNWEATFDFTVEQTSASEASSGLGPPPRYLWYEVTLVAATHLYRPFVGQVRMLPDVFTQEES